MSAASEPVPERYEFRCWPDRPVALPEWLETAEREARSDMYCLRPGNADLLPKLRGGTRFQIKRRLDEEGGLERWAMAFDAALPLGTEDRAAIEEQLGLVVAAEQARDGHDLVAALARQGLQVAKVSKYRRQAQRGGVKIEATLVSGPGAPQLSIGLEGTNLQAVRDAAVALGVADLPNRSYHDWLTRQTAATPATG